VTGDHPLHRSRRTSDDITQHYISRTYKDAHRVVGVLIHDLSLVRPGGRTSFPLAEYLEYEQRNHVFEEVIGGGHEDVTAVDPIVALKTE
jgi:hypothetical protein